MPECTGCGKPSAHAVIDHTCGGRLEYCEVCFASAYPSTAPTTTDAKEAAREACPVFRVAAEGHHPEPCITCEHIESALVAHGQRQREEGYHAGVSDGWDEATADHPYVDMSKRRAEDNPGEVE